jgi:hypothetical protein
MQGMMVRYRLVAEFVVRMLMQLNELNKHNLMAIIINLYTKHVLILIVVASSQQIDRRDPRRSPMLVVA